MGMRVRLKSWITRLAYFAFLYVAAYLGLSVNGEFTMTSQVVELGPSDRERVVRFEWQPMLCQYTSQRLPPGRLEIPFFNWTYCRRDVTANSVGTFFTPLIWLDQTYIHESRILIWRNYGKEPRLADFPMSKPSSKYVAHPYIARFIF